MPILGAILLGILKKYWLPILIVTSIGGSLWYYGNTKYKQGLAKGEAIAAKAEAKAREIQTQLETLERERDEMVEEWNKQVANREREAQEIRRQQNAAVTKATNAYRKQMEQLLKEKKELDRRIKELVPPNSTVSMPSGIRLLHDTATKGSTTVDIYIDSSPDPGRITGETETFEASAFTERLLENIAEYNKLVAKYNALLDLVLQWKETIDGINNKGANRTSSTTQ